LIILYSFLPYIFDSVIYLINIETFISILSWWILLSKTNHTYQ
jgi:hypothetical protein